MAEIEFTVAVIHSSMAKITFVVAEITFKVPVITSSVAKINYVVAEIIFKVAVIISALAMSFVVAEKSLLQWPRSLS